MLQQLPSSLGQLASEIRPYLQAINRSLAKGGQGRLQRFIHRGKVEAGKSNTDDGYVSDDDCVAVLFDVSEGGPRRTKKRWAVYYANVVKVTFDKLGKRVPGARAHLHELTGEAVCKWFDEKLDGKEVVRHHGKRAYHLTLNNSTGFNDKVEFPNILTGVRMTLDRQNDCWLLNDEDHQYVEQQLARWSTYHNCTPAQQKRQGQWVKDVRQGHDRLKTKVFDQLGIEI